MAGPHVAGVVALLWSARPQLVRDIAATKTILQNTANPNVIVTAADLRRHALDPDPEQLLRLRARRCPGRGQLGGRVNANSDTHSDPDRTPTPTATGYSHSYSDADSNAHGNSDATATATLPQQRHATPRRPRRRQHATPPLQQRRTTPPATPHHRQHPRRHRRQPDSAWHTDAYTAGNSDTSRTPTPTPPATPTPPRHLVHTAAHATPHSDSSRRAGR